jgi:hypothetical protein
VKDRRIEGLTRKSGGGRRVASADGQEGCGGRLPKEPQVTGRCGYVDDVGVGHLIDSAASVASVLSIWRVSCDESALLECWSVPPWLCEVLTGDGDQRMRILERFAPCRFEMRGCGSTTRDVGTVW